MTSTSQTFGTSPKRCHTPEQHATNYVLVDFENVQPDLSLLAQYLVTR